MIRISELRIGNLVIYKPYGNRDGETKKIEGLLGMKAFFNKYNNESAMLHYLRGIPLTAEWLERMGWYDLAMGFFIPIGEGNPRRQLNWNDIDHSVKIMDPGGYVITIAGNVQFVHQLQNLYFALTGEELSINEKHA